MALTIREKVSLAQYTTLKVGGVADYMTEVGSEEEVWAACQFAKQTGTLPLILGGGSNILVGDEGFRGLTLIMAIKGREYTETNDRGCHVRLGAGEVFDDVVAETAEKGLWGLENLSAIPGTVGATPVQNVGAYGVEVSSLIISVEAIHIETGEKKIFTNDECNFLYRDSFFKTTEGKSWVITFVTYALLKVPNPILEYADLVSLNDSTELTPRVIREAVQHIRSGKFPDWTKVGTAGSFFKNPRIADRHFKELVQRYPGIPGYIQDDGAIKVSLGWVLDKVCGLKGYCVGSVCLFEKQALVLVAHEGASATDVKKFAANIQEKVFLKTKIIVEPEVLFV